MTNSIRNTTLSSSRVGRIQLNKLEKLLCKTIPKNCNDKELCRYAQRHYSGISKQGRRDLTRTEMQEIIVLLKSALDSIRAEASCINLVATIHTTIGLLYQAQREMKQAIYSFITALWVQTRRRRDDSCNQVDIALSVHRIALCHASLAHHDDAIRLLNKSLKTYTDAGLNKRHHLIAQARKELERVQETKRLAMRARDWWDKKQHGGSTPPRAPTKCDSLNSTKLSLVAHGRMTLEIIDTRPIQEDKNKAPRKNSLLSVSSLSCSMERVIPTSSHYYSSSDEFSSTHAQAA